MPARSWAQPPLAWKGTSRQVTSACVWDITNCSLTQPQTKTHLSFKIRRPHTLAKSIPTKQQHAQMPWRKSCCKSGFCIARDLSLLILIKTVRDLSFLKAPSKCKLKNINLQHKTLRRGRNSLISGKLLKYLLYPLKAQGKQKKQHVLFVKVCFAGCPIQLQEGFNRATQLTMQRGSCL